MSKIFLTSDSHFGHDRGFVYESRGFNSIEEHDTALIERWNSAVSPEDIVFHLGDVMLGDNEHGMECLRKLNGTIHIIPGNHDSATRIQLYKTLPNVTVQEPTEYGLQPTGGYFKHRKYLFMLTHHPSQTSNLEKSCYLREHILNIHGHTHSKKIFERDIPYAFNCAMDAHNCTPVLLDDAIEMMKEKVKECIELL